MVHHIITNWQDIINTPNNQTSLAFHNYRLIYQCFDVNVLIISLEILLIKASCCIKTTSLCFVIYVINNNIIGLLH